MMMGIKFVRFVVYYCTVQYIFCCVNKYNDNINKYEHTYVYTINIYIYL